MTNPASLGELFAPSAYAGKKSKSTESEAVQKAAEQQKEQAKQAAEIEREQAKQAAEVEREQSKSTSDTQTEQQSSSGSAEREDSDRSVSTGGRSVSEIRTDDDDRPPSTVLELLRRATQPDKPRTPSSTRGRGNGGPGVSGPPARNEILAVNLSKSGADRAKKLGFSVGGSTHSGHSGGRVTRLIPPPGMDARQARDLMQKGRPDEQFAINQRYSYYQPARKDGSDGSDGNGGKSIPARHGRGIACTEDRCFGRQVIRWHDDVERCAADLRIGVIDTPVDNQHPAFAGAQIHMGGFVPEGARPAPPWHGTGVLSVLAGDSNSGTPGLVPHANFYVASVFFNDEKGKVETDTVSVLSALEWMSAFDVKIVNMSFSGPRDELVERTINRMSEEGVLFVAAVGNDGPAAAPSYPAAYRPVVAVTAIGKDLRNYPYANRGNKIDASAPGVDIWSAVPNAREGYHTGTSFAAPYVTAILATVYGHSDQRRRPDELLDSLTAIDLGPPGRDPIYGRGLLTAPANCGAPESVAQDSPAGAGAIASTERRLPPAPAGRATPSAGPLSLR
jgi:hypothetical protein